jgi:type IV pilus assembly protein PilF
MSTLDRLARVPLAAMALCLLGALACATGGPGPDEAAQESQRQAVAHYNLGVHHLGQGNTALAIRELLAAEQLDPVDPWIQLTLAEAYRRKAKVEDCERHLHKALAIDPDFHNARLTLSALYIQTGRFEEAVTEGRKLADDPTFPAPWRAHSNLGYALFKAGHIQEARENLQLALEYRSYDPKTLLNLAELEAETGHKLKAIGLLKKVLEHDPGALAESEVNYRLAELFVSLGKRDEALAHLSRAVEARPNGPWAKRSQEYLELLQ